VTPPAGLPLPCDADAAREREPSGPEPKPSRFSTQSAWAWQEIGCGSEAPEKRHTGALSVQSRWVRPQTPAAGEAREAAVAHGALRLGVIESCIPARLHLLLRGANVESAPARDPTGGGQGVPGRKASQARPGRFLLRFRFRRLPAAPAPRPTPREAGPPLRARSCRWKGQSGQVFAVVWAPLSVCRRRHQLLIKWLHRQLYSYNDYRTLSH